MRATAILSALLLAACGAVREHADCAASTDCPAGQYCARTPDGGVCWPDAVAPTVGGVEVECVTSTTAGACRRDGVLRVRATVADDAELVGAEVTLDLDGGARPVAMSRAGDRWEAEVPLRRYPFDHFSHGVVATVIARDGARNEASLDASVATTVTRAGWSLPLGALLSPPAISAAGVVAIPTNTGRTVLMSWDGEPLTSVQTGAALQHATAALAAGTSFWVGTDGGTVYEITNSGDLWSVVARATTGDPLRGSLAITSTGTVVAVSETGVVYAVTPISAKNSFPAGPANVGPVIDEGDTILTVAGGAAHRFGLSPGGIPVPSWAASVPLGGTVLDPIACTSSLLVTPDTGTGGLVKAVSMNGDPTTVATTAAPSNGAAILADGSIVVPEQTKTLSRWTSTGAAFPGWLKPDLGGAPRTPLALTGTQPLVVSTAKGAIHALKPDGSIAWTGQLSSGTASLQPGNIYTPPGQAAGETLSTAYFAGADGVLHAVIVDGALDGAAPWPKAFHDPRNTNRAGPQP